MPKKNNISNNKNEQILTSENNQVNYDKLLNEEKEENLETMKSIDDFLFKAFEQKLETETEDLELELELPKEKVPLEQAVQDYQSGVCEAFDYVYKHYKPVFERVSYRHNDEDLIQELSIVLYRATLTFDVAGGAKFNTYFWKCARNHMGTLRIRKNAKKRTAEHGIVSMQQSFNTQKDSDVELGAFIEDPGCSRNYNDKIFDLILKEKVYPFLKDDDIQAIKMIMQGFTLEEIGKKLGGITAPAVHVKFRRFAKKKNVGKQFQELYQLYGS